MSKKRKHQSPLRGLRAIKYVYCTPTVSSTSPTTSQTSPVTITVISWDANKKIVRTTLTENPTEKRP